jgi:rod shape-determining protein MreC
MRFIYTKTFVRLFLVFLLVAVFIMGDATGYSSRIKNSFFEIYGRGTSAVANGTSATKDFFGVFFTIRQIARENAELNQRINDLAFENSRLILAQRENSALRVALELKDQSSYNLQAVEVKAQDPTGFTQTILIDRGADVDISLGAAVVSAPGILVGKVSKVHKSTAEVILLTDPSISVNAEVTDSGAKGLVFGEHGLSLAFDLVTQNELIKPTDQVVTSGLAGEFPRGILIGEIVSIQSSASELFQKAFITPAADLRNLQFLFVVQ